MIIPVHILTRKTLIAEYGSDIIHVSSNSAILPLLIAEPKKKSAQFNHTITIDCDDMKVLAAIRRDAGHNLYRMHMQQIVQWMDMHVRLDVPALNAMNMYYKAIDLDLDDLPPERTYKRWQRAQIQKNSENRLYNTDSDVLVNTTYLKRPLSAVQEQMARLVQDDPDTFFRSSDDQPDESMLRKALMHLMISCGWLQSEVAERLGISQQAVSKAVHSYELRQSFKNSGKKPVPARTSGLLSYMHGLRAE